jgi:hypothetical protein
MTKKKTKVHMPPGAKTLPGRDTDTGLIKKVLDTAGQFKKPLSQVDKFSNLGDKLT